MNKAELILDVASGNLVAFKGTKDSVRGGEPQHRKGVMWGRTSIGDPVSK